MAIGTISIDTIMNDIKNQMKESGINQEGSTFRDAIYASSSSSFGLGDEQLDSALAYITAHPYVAWYRDLPGGPIGFIKRVIRKLAFFIMEPYVVEQNRYNQMTATCIEKLTRIVVQQHRTIRELRQR